MIVIEPHPHSIDGRQLTCISDGELSRGDKKGIVMMNISIWSQEGHESELQIDVQDETLETKGDYTPLYYSKEELGQMIEYLKECYDLI